MRIKPPAAMDGNEDAKNCHQALAPHFDHLVSDAAHAGWSDATVAEQLVRLADLHQQQVTSYRQLAATPDTAPSQHPDHHSTGAPTSPRRRVDSSD